MRGKIIILQKNYRKGFPFGLGRFWDYSIRVINPYNNTNVEVIHINETDSYAFTRDTIVVQRNEKLYAYSVAKMDYIGEYNFENFPIKKDLRFSSIIEPDVSCSFTVGGKLYKWNFLTNCFFTSDCNYFYTCKTAVIRHHNDTIHYSSHDCHTCFTVGPSPQLKNGHAILYDKSHEIVIVLTSLHLCMIDMDGKLIGTIEIQKPRCKKSHLSMKIKGKDLTVTYHYDDFSTDTFVVDFTEWFVNN